MNQGFENVTKFTKKLGNWMVTGNLTETTYRTALMNQAYSKDSSPIYRDNSMNKVMKKPDAMDNTTSLSDSMDNPKITMRSKNINAGTNQNATNNTLDFSEPSRQRLQEAIIWSEILGKPMCKRRERR
jgi:hypothetical protein